MKYEITLVDLNGEKKNIQIPDNFIDISSMNEFIEESIFPRGNIRLGYLKNEDRCYFCKDGIGKIKLNAELQKLLGFENHKLEKDYEVAKYECSLNRYKFDELRFKIIGGKITFYLEDMKIIITIPDDLFFFSELNDFICKHLILCKDSFSFSIDPDSLKSIIKLTDKVTKVKLSPTLKEILGYEDNTIYPGSTVSENKISLETPPCRSCIDTHQETPSFSVELIRKIPN